MAKNEATLWLKIKDTASATLDEFRSRFVITAGDIVNFAKQIGGAIVDFAKEAVEAYREEEHAINKLTTSMVNQGVYTQDLKVDYLELAGALQKVSLYGDETIVNAVAILQSYSKNKAVTEELTKATLDLAAAKEIDLATAAEMVGKVISGSTTSLNREKLAISENATEGERYAAVLDHINGKYAGQAEAAAKGLGATTQLSNAWSDFMEIIGRGLAPSIELIARATTKTLEFFNALAGPAASNTKLPEINAQIDELTKRIERLGRAGPKNEMAALQIPQLQKELAEYEAIRQEILAKEKDSADKSNEIAAQKISDNRAIKAAADAENLEYEINQIGMSEAQKLAAQIAADDQKIQNAQTTEEKLRAIKDKTLALEQLRKIKEKELQDKADKETIANRTSTLNTISTLQSSHNKVLAAAGKAAGIAQIAIDTPVAISKALAAFPPPFNFAAAGLVGAAMAAQAARIAGVQLADGGIVRATPGGIQATIGEGGQDEAVIPLDRAGEFGFGGGGGVTIHFNGPIMGNESQAMEFARAIDKSLYKLRQSNQSIAFETDVV